VGDAEEDTGGGALYDAGQVAGDGLAGSCVDGGASAWGDILSVLHNHAEDDVKEEVEV
jgi:hypothetical protein